MVTLAITRSCVRLGFALVTLALSTTAVSAAPDGLKLTPCAECAVAEQGGNPGHAYRAPQTQLPSHQFQRAPRWHKQPELAVHFGLLQPLLFRGFNAALDLRWGPFVASYSHGQGLNYSQNPSLALTPEERGAGLQLRSPWTTGGGVGVVLLDELYVMLDVKRHRYEVSLGSEEIAYTTTSVGAELGYRFFVWRGLFAQPMLRYWPNVHSTLPADRAQVGALSHQAKSLDLFANVSLGWAFEI